MKAFYLPLYQPVWKGVGDKIHVISDMTDEYLINIVWHTYRYHESYCRKLDIDFIDFYAYDGDRRVRLVVEALRRGLTKSIPTQLLTTYLKDHLDKVIANW
jgi:hypothetical protein